MYVHLRLPAAPARVSGTWRAIQVFPGGAFVACPIASAAWSPDVGVQSWRRGHISMSSFFRDHVCIPLGGGRCWRRSPAEAPSSREMFASLLNEPCLRSAPCQPSGPKERKAHSGTAAPGREAARTRSNWSPLNLLRRRAAILGPRGMLRGARVDYRPLTASVHWHSTYSARPCVEIP